MPPRLYPRRNTDRNRIIWDIRNNNRIRPNQNIIANCHATQYFSPGTNIDTIAYNRCTRVPYPSQSNHNAVPNPAIVTKLDITTDHNSTKMINHKVTAYFDFTGKLNSCQDLHQFVKEFINQ